MDTTSEIPLRTEQQNHPRPGSPGVGSALNCMCSLYYESTSSAPAMPQGECEPESAETETDTLYE
ncbi:MAG: hypothetical protein Q4F38_06720 [Akkermansia sp.]|nr:hypothetical protein [Akkermansia sp.]